MEIGRSRSGRRKKHAGVRDIARAAGVSTATVSRVFNEADRVSPEVRRKVIEAADALSYMPNHAARALTSAKSYRIGALIPTIDNAIFARFIDALGKEVRAYGYGLTLAVHEYNLDRELTEAKALVASGIDGLVLTGGVHHDDLYRMLEVRGIAYVLTSVFLPDDPHPTVGYDNRAPARRIARHVLELGHREIGILIGELADNDRTAGRLAGFLDGAADYDIEIPPERIVERRFDITAAKEGFDALLRRSERITAVLCGNDTLALGALFGAQAAGLRVPRDLSITSFEGLPITQAVSPSLTSVYVPTGEMGHRAGQFLIDRLSGKDGDHAIEIETRLILGGSTAGPRPMEPGPEGD